MVRKYKRKTDRDPPNEDLIQEALRQVREDGLSRNKAATLAGVSEKTIRRRLINAPRKDGGQTRLPEEAERELALLVSLKAKSGVISTNIEIRNLVSEFIKENKNKDTDLGELLRTRSKFRVKFLAMTT